MERSANVLKLASITPETDEGRKMVRPTSRHHKRRDNSDSRFTRRFHRRRFNISGGTILKPAFSAADHIEEQLELIDFELLNVGHGRRS